MTWEAWVTIDPKELNNDGEPVDWHARFFGLHSPHESIEPAIKQGVPLDHLDAAVRGAIELANAFGRKTRVHLIGHAGGPVDFVRLEAAPEEQLGSGELVVDHVG